MVGDEFEFELLDELLLWEVDVVVDCFFAGAVVVLCFCDRFRVTLFVCAFIATTHRHSDRIVRIRFIC